MMKKYIRKTIQIILGISMLLFLLPIHVQGQCLNLDFSMNNFTNWQPYDGNCYGMYISISQSAVIPGKHTIMNAAQLILNNNIMDEQCRHIKKVPDGFNYSVKLGNSGTGAEMEALEYTMNVDSSNSLLILHFAWVMENPGHTPEEQPRFSMIIKDSLGRKLPSIPCGDVNFIASANLTNLVCNTIDMVARNWTTVGFNLETLIGQKIKIYFETRDCTQSGHFGYAYMVGECRPMAISVMHCNQDTAYLSAPDGFVQYSWKRSSHPTWIKEGSKELYQNILIDDPVDGEEFTCALVSELGDECRANLRVTIPVKTIINADFIYGIMSNGNVDTTGHNSVSWYDTCTRKATFVDLSTVENSTKASILWEIPSLNAISADSLFTYTFPPTDTIVKYLVRLTVTAESGCVHSTERYITIYPLPVVDNMADLVFCHGTKQIINFTGTDMNINISEWTNNDTTIGFAASGTGNISFIANNTGTSPSTATITITPKNESPQCTGHLKSFTITVNPLPVVNNIENSIICAGEKQIINFTGTNIDVYNSTWTNSDTTIGLPANGNGNISFIATNTGTMPLLSVITITPISNKGCVAAAEFFAIIVNPLPVMDTIEDLVICAGEKQIIHFTGTNIDLDSSMWINFNPAIGLDTMGNGNISFTATDTGTSTLISAIVMTPKSSNGCVGEMKSVVITVKPTPVLDTVENIVLCAEENRTIYFTGKNINLDSTVWTNSDTAIGLPANGIGNISFTATNNTTLPFISTVTVTLESNEGCVGTSELFTIIVNPLPVMDSIGNLVVCAGAEQSIHFIGTNIDLDSSIWTNVNPDIGLGTNGNGNISFTATDTVTSSFISSVRMTPKSFFGCVGEVETFTVTVSPLPVMDTVKDIVLCPGEHQIIYFTNKNFYLDSSTWTNNNTDIGLDANGIGNISFTASNNTTIPLISTVTVTPKSNEGCVAASKFFTVTVNPLPVMDSIKDIVICAGEKQSFYFIGTNIDLDSSMWTNVNTDIGLGKNGNGNISFTVTDTGTSLLISTITMTPKSIDGCVGEMKSAIITVKPTPVMDSVKNIVLCAGENQIISITGKSINLDSTVWTNSNPAIGLVGNGIGNISFTASNNTTLPFISTVTVTPKSNEGCVGESELFTVIVNPIPVMDSIGNLVVCAGAEQNIHFSGTNIDLDSSVWTNVNTAIGLGTNGIGNISFTATDTVTSSFISSVRMTPKSFTGCVGEVQTVIVTVSPLPVMDSVKDIVLCPGERQVIYFTNKNFYLDSSTWTNSNTDIGLSANGKGTISFTATNNTTIPSISTVTVSPKSNEGCVAASKFFTITVNPIPVMDSIEDLVICAGAGQNIYFTGTNIDLDSSMWTNVNTDIGLGKNGNGNISFTATDTVTSSFISSVRMIPKSIAGCVGEVKTFTITVNPLPVMDDVKDISLCIGERQVINFSNKNFYLDSSTWTNSNTAIGLGANGRGNISFTATNTGRIPLIATITVTPKSNEGCVAASKFFTVTVNPIPVMDSIEDIVLCAEEEQSVYFTGTNIYLDSSVWTNVNTDIGLGTNGIGNISFTATNTVTSSLISSVRVIPKSAAGCVGEAKTFTITVHPLPVMENVNDIVICAKEKQNINFTGTNIDLDSSTWTNSNTAIGLGANGRGNISFTSPDTVTSLTATIIMTPKSIEGCVSESKIFTVTINPDIRILAEVNDSIFCEGSDIEFEILNADELTDINWSGPDNFSSSVSNPHISDISLNNAGMYYVNAITYCNREAISDSFLISVLPDVTLDMADTLFICHSEIVLSSNVKNATWYQWNTEEETEDITVSSPGKYWITATNPRCRAVDTIVVLEYNIHSFEIQTMGDICRDGNVNLYLGIQDENVFYNWSTGDTSDNITVYETGLYKVEIYFMGCSSSQRILVECPCEFWIPDVFSPNGDGLNDTFIPIPQTLLNTFSMYIWDRYGALIFRTDTYTSWNGTNKEKNAAKGVYTYVIYYSCLTKPDKEFMIQGRITLER